MNSRPSADDRIVPGGTLIFIAAAFHCKSEWKARMSFSLKFKLRKGLRSFSRTEAPRQCGNIFDQRTCLNRIPPPSWSIRRSHALSEFSTVSLELISVLIVESAFRILSTSLSLILTLFASLFFLLGLSTFMPLCLDTVHFFVV
jgi:hypothetical protein